MFYVCVIVVVVILECVVCIFSYWSFCELRMFFDLDKFEVDFVVV